MLHSVVKVFIVDTRAERQSNRLAVARVREVRKNTGDSEIARNGGVYEQ